MPSERAITQMVDVFTDVIDLGGVEERTAIVPNLSVIDAAPTGLTNFIIVQDDRDGDNILAKTVPGVVYANNDKVNVLFIRGAEPIAFQQGSESANSGLWEIVPATSTDIQYDKGNVIVGDTPSFTRLFNVVSAAGGALVGIEGDNAGGDVTALLANLGDSNIDTTLEIEARQGTRFGGKIVFGRENALAWSTAANADGFISLSPVLNNVQSEAMRVASSGNVGIGWTTTNLKTSIAVSGTETLPLVPGDFLPSSVSTEDSMAFGIINEDAAANYVGMSFQIRASNAPGAVIGLERDANFDGDLFFTIRTGAGTASEIMRLEHGGNVGIGVDPALGKLHVDQASTTAAIPVAYFDQADVSEEMFQFATTIGVGNAIEAVGAKTLTTTHFIKVTIPGGLTRYFPVGTIA